MLVSGWNDRKKVGVIGYPKVIIERRDTIMVKKFYLGHLKYLNNGIDVANEYENLAKSNYLAANVLYGKNLFNEAGYLYIQAMEKMVKAKVFSKIDVYNKESANIIRETSHSIDKTIEYLILIYSANDEVLREQLRNNLLNIVLKELRFNQISNRVRYPELGFKNKKYTTLILNDEDCINLKMMYKNLTRYLDDIYKL